MKKIAYITSKNGGLLNLLMKYKNIYKCDWEITVYSSKPNFILSQRCAILHLTYVNFRNEEELIELLDNYFDLIFLGGYLKILSKKFVKNYPNTINYHPGKIPKLSGLNPQKQAIEKKVRVTANTIHYVDSGIDTGKIIKEQIEKVYEDDTVESLSERLKIKSIPLIVEAFDTL